MRICLKASSWGLAVFLIFSAARVAAQSQSTALEDDPWALGSGLVVDDEAYRRTPLIPLMRSVSEIPERFSLKRFAPTPKSQGSTGTCVAWATAYSARTILRAQQQNVTNQEEIDRLAFSPSYVYNSLIDPSANAKCQAGLIIDHALSTLKGSGVTSLSALPFDCAVEITENHRSVARDNVLYDFRRLFDRGARDKAPAVKRALAAGRVVVFGMQVPRSFRMARGVSVWHPNPGEVDSPVGHAMTVVAYDDTLSGGSFQVINSWGKSWGDDGFIWIPYEHFQNFVMYGFELLSRPLVPDMEGSLAINRSDGTAMPLMRTFSAPTRLRGAHLARVRLSQPYAAFTTFEVVLTNEEPAYVYALGTDATREVSMLFPYPSATSTSAFLPDAGGELAIPGGQGLLQLDERTGTTTFVLLYSAEPLEIDAVASYLQDNPGTLEERLVGALGNRLVQASSVGLLESDGRIAFEASVDSAQSVVPLIVEFEHVAVAASTDLVAPVLTLLSPQKGAPRRMRGPVRGDSVLVRGTAFDQSNLRHVTVNGKRARLLDDHVFEAFVSPAGSPVLVLEAVDAAGNETTQRYADALAPPDTTGPMISLSTSDFAPGPSYPSTLGTGEGSVKVRLAGIVGDASPMYGVYVNGVSADLTPDGRFAVEIMLPTASPDVTIRAVDASDNVTERIYHRAPK